MSKETVLAKKPKAMVERKILIGAPCQYRIIDPTATMFGQRRVLCKWCDSEDRAWKAATQSLFTKSLGKMDE